MRRALAAVAVAVVVAALVTASCAKKTPEPVVRLDGSARVPDDEGVATSLSFERITLDGKRTYPISRELVSFSTYTRAVEPMIGRKGQYVQIGLRTRDGKRTMVWMAGVAQVVPGAKPTVYYKGILRRFEPATRRLVFGDGTVFRVAAGVEPPKPPAPVVVEIDPATHLAGAVTIRR